MPGLELLSEILSILADFDQVRFIWDTDEVMLLDKNTFCTNEEELLGELKDKVSKVKKLLLQEDYPAFELTIRE